MARPRQGARTNAARSRHRFLECMVTSERSPPLTSIDDLRSKADSRCVIASGIPRDGDMATAVSPMKHPETATKSRTGVCIVGGGPAGMLLGLLLAKRGAEVIVLEGHPTFDREFRGEVLQPSTARLLDQIGLLEYILDQPHLTLTEGKLRVRGRVAAGFDFKTISPEYPYAIWMPQPIFLEALVKKAAPFPGFACWMGAHVSELIEEKGAVVGVKGFRHGKDPFEIRADVVVGADGRHSTVRRLGGFATEY